MNQMALYNDTDFSNLFARFHENDNSLVCRDNILYYNGETTEIHGSYKVVHGECVNLGNLRVSNLDYQIWRLKPALLFFNIRETVIVKNLTKENLYNFLTQVIDLCSKENITPVEKTSIKSFIDYYSSLKSIESYLRYELFDVYNDITKYIINATKSMTSSNITPGFRLIYEELFGTVKNDEESSSSNQNSYQRIKTSNNKPKITPIPIPFDNNQEKELRDTGFINVIVLSLFLIGIAAVSAFLLLS